jgi:hypothetical protein
MHSMFVELHVTMNYIKIVSVAQQCFCGKFILPANIKCST